jgi:hypothetical protein
MPAFQVKTDEKSVADNNIENNMEVLLMSKKKENRTRKIGSEM